MVINTMKRSNILFSAIGFCINIPQYENKKDYFLVYRCFILQFFVFLVQIWDSIHPKTYEYKTTIDMKRRDLHLMLLAAAMSLCGCSQVANKSYERSDYYTRGIGVYPGAPAEDPSPELKPDDTYRNIAHLRTAYHSSSYDYNLTAQLVTDGIISDKEPAYLDFTTHEGEVRLREREWTLDNGPYSKNTLKGDDVFINYGLINWSEAADEITLTGTVAYKDKEATKGYEITIQGSKDGSRWSELGNLSGRGLPGKAGRHVIQTDPNKQTEKIEYHTRSLNESIKLSNTGSYSHYRVKMKMAGAVEWSYTAINFYNNGQQVDMLPSKHFNSTWMSAGAGEEWIYIDLGSHSTFDKVKLHWINKAAEGEIQVSDDATNWKAIASLPGGDATTDEIACKGKARYVRVLMQKPANNHNYLLSEVEVMGRGGLVPYHKVQSTVEGKKYALAGGNWTLQRASEVAATGENISKADYDASNWVVATVPGTVLTSYKNIGAVPNPNYADNIFQISESFFNSNFWYRNEFDLPADFKQERLFLNLDGINWKANIYLNGNKIGRMEGAFIRGMYDITDIAVEGKNVLAIEIEKNAHIGAIKEKYEVNTDFNGGILGADNPTFHASIGWDWISTICGRNIGIYNDVYLTTSGKVTIQDPFVQSKLALPATTATLTPEVIVKNHTDKAVKGVLSGKIGDIAFEQEVELAAGEQKRAIFDPQRFPQLKEQNLKLWWPKGYGEPHLYDANFTFSVDGKASDSKDFKVGIRQMDFNEDNGILSLYINGRRFVGRGGNWGFGENNLNYRGREYDIAVAHHANMNFTMMRNWVGQIGDEELYEACDRHGIMVWQDFWLANPADGPDPYDNEMFIANAEDYVRRIRSHASIGIYCGRNEGFPPEVIDKALRRIVKEEHPGIHYISSSADEVVSGHGPYRALPVREYFALKSGSDKFHSERGMPNVMNYESLARTLKPEDMWPQSNKWGQHDYTMEGAQRGSTFNEIIEKGFGKPQSAKEFTDLAQWINYDGYRGMFESRSLNRKGLLLWMTHPAWPSMVWQTYDYYFEPTAAYFGCMKGNEPLHIQWNAATDEVEVVNYSAGNHPSLTAKAQVINMDGSVAWEKQTMLNSNEDTTERCFKLEFPAEVSSAHFVKLWLYDGENIVSDNFYIRGTEEGNYQAIRQMPKVSLEKQVEIAKSDNDEWSGSITIKNPSDTPALMVRINVIGAEDGDQILPMFYSDNYFSLLPGEEKVVSLNWKDVDTRGNKAEVVVTGYNVK